MDGTHDDAPAPIGYTQPASLCITGMADAPSSELGPDAVWMERFLNSDRHHRSDQTTARALISRSWRQRLDDRCSN